MANWMQSESKRMKKEGTEGSFSSWAKRKGFSSTLAAAKSVMANKGKYDKHKRQQANEARNMIRASKNR